MPDTSQPETKQEELRTTAETPTTAVARIPTEQELVRMRVEREHREALAFGLSSREEYVALRDSIAQGATSAEFRMHLLIAKRLGLSPIGGQVHFVKRMTKVKEGGQWRWKEVFSTQVGIDGFRAVAEYSHEYEGPAGLPLFCYANESAWTEEERVDANGKPVPPIAAKAGVWRTGWKEAVYATALYASYAEFKNVKDEDQGEGYDGTETAVAPKKIPTKMWAKMPHLMLAKCAEALALRKAFPAQLGGVYTTDEMAQAGSDAPDTVDGDFKEVPAPPTPATAAPDSGTAAPDASVEKAQEAAIDQLNESLPKGAKWLGAMLKAKKAHLGLRGAFQDRAEAHVKACGPDCEHLKAITGEVKPT